MESTGAPSRKLWLIRFPQRPASTTFTDKLNSKIHSFPATSCYLLVNELPEKWKHAESPLKQGWTVAVYEAFCLLIVLHLKEEIFWGDLYLIAFIALWDCRGWWGVSHTVRWSMTICTDTRAELQVVLHQPPLKWIKGHARPESAAAPSIHCNEKRNWWLGGAFTFSAKRQCRGERTLGVFRTLYAIAGSWRTQPPHGVQ